MKNRLFRGVATAALIPVCLSACDKRSGTVTVPTPTPPTTSTPAPTGTFQSMFGSAFAAIFNTAPTAAAPIDPAATDVPALNATAAPIDN